jgi:mannose-6-phosphate isomerase-like protein (cupin superfamily)
MSEPGPFNLSSTYLRLRSDATVEPLPVDDTFWPRIATGQLGTFHHEYLVTSHAVDTDWAVWEMHPKGDEIVCLLSGSVTFVLERERGHQAIELGEPGAYLIVPGGTWHTARARRPSRMLFITAGEGTQHRDIDRGR